MEGWREENLVKLSVKELKSLARKSNVNPNFKKAELVKALLANSIDAADQSTICEAQTSRRMTRSRVSMWQTSDEMLDSLKESKTKLKVLEDNGNTKVKDFYNDKGIKNKRVKASENPDTFGNLEMFSLVSSIQLAPKPLLEITNKDVVRHEQNKQGELRIDINSKGKLNKVKQKNTGDVLPLPNKEVGETAEPMNACMTYESSEEKDCDLNSTFIVEGEGNITQNVKKANKKSTCSLSLKREKGGNSPISETSQVNNQFSNSQTVNKLRKSKKGNERNEDGSRSNEINQNVENLIVQRPSKITDEVSDTSDSKVGQIKKKRKRENSPPPSPQNSNDTSETNIVQADKNKSKRKKGSQSHVTKVLNSTETVLDDKPKRRGKKKHELSEEIGSPKTEELTEVIETSNNCSNLQTSCKQNGSTPELLNKSSVVNDNDLVKMSLTRKQIKSTEGDMDDQDISSVEGQTGRKSTQAPVRSSTFILSDSSVAETDKMPVPQTPRQATFTLDASDGKGPQRRSMRFSPGSSVANSITSNENANKPGKSIGNRIMQNSMMKQGDKTSSKKEPVSALKKTTLNSTTSGSVFKKRPASKMPDFKKIHQQLFNNMESLSEHKKRQLNRAQGLLQSPAVPRCALPSPQSAAKAVNPVGKMSNTKVKDQVAPPRTPVVPSRTPVAPPRTAVVPSRTPVAPPRTPVAPPRTPVAPSPLATKLKTPVARQIPAASRKQAPVTSSVNRFGFKNPVKKQEATNIITTKMPSVKKEQKKEQGRNILKGVRINKRFELQMQMRQAAKNNEK